MKNSIIAYCIVLGITAFGYSYINNWPQANITNGLVSAKIYLPDNANGYYQGTRFDWSGVISELEYKGHSYFGQWFDDYQPKTHDAIQGPVEDFAPLGYEDAGAGKSFVKIGVGVLKKDDLSAYQFSKTYTVVNPGKWDVTIKKDNVKFTHTLNDGDGYSYTYSKTVGLEKGKPELVLRHQLTNTGTKIIETEVYDHNFFLIDKQPTGPGITIDFSFNAQAKGQGFGSIAKLDNKQISYLRPLQKNEHVYAGNVTGFSNDLSDYNIHIENKVTGAGVKITCDKPLAKMVFWASSTVSCPEPYIKLKVLPGQSISWNIAYNFYTFPHQ